MVVSLASGRGSGQRSNTSNSDKASPARLVCRCRVRRQQTQHLGKFLQRELREAHRTNPDVRITASSSSRASVPRATWPLRGWQRVLHEPALKRGHGRLDPGVLLPRIQMICSSVNRSRFSRPSPLRVTEATRISTSL